MNAKSPDTQKHTPGPWTLEREKDIRLLVRTTPDRCYAFHPDDEPNARLIASAPALLEACQKALADLQDIYELADLPEQLRLNVVGSIGRLIGACAEAEGRNV